MTATMQEALSRWLRVPVASQREFVIDSHGAEGVERARSAPRWTCCTSRELPVPHPSHKPPSNRWTGLGRRRRGGGRGQCAVVDLKGAIGRVEILLDNVYDDELWVRIQVQEWDKQIDEVEKRVRCASVQHDMPGVKLVSQKNRWQRTMKHATNCHTRKVDPPVCSQEQRLSSIQQKIIYTIRHKFSQQNPRLKLDYTSRFVHSHNRSSCRSLFFWKVAFQNESRVRIHRTLMISLPEHIRLEMNVNTFDNRKHGRDEIDVVTLQKREHVRATHGMHGFQKLHTELILDQLGLNSTEENWSSVIYVVAQVHW